MLNRPHRAAFAVAVALAAPFAVSPAAAQCGPTWIPGDGIPGLGDTPSAAVMWDPDGAGPQPKRLVVAGGMEVAGSSRVNHVAMWDGTQWLPLGGPVPGLPTAEGFGVMTMAVTASGDLIIAGAGPSNGLPPHPPAYVAIWDGATWAPLGEPFSEGFNFPRIETLEALPDGRIIAAGNFEFVGQQPVANIACWDGQQWSPMGAGFSRGLPENATVYDVALTASGEIVAAGSFSHADNAPASNVARWDGSAWHPLAEGTNDTIWTLAVLPTGDLVAGGRFSQAGGGAAYRVARWTGQNWSTMGAWPSIHLYDLVVTPAGHLIGGGWAGTLARWDAGVWTSFAPALNSAPSATGGGAGNPDVLCLVAEGTDLFVGGRFRRAGDELASYIARWDSSAWHSLGEGTNNNVHVFKSLTDGSLVAGGSFWEVDGIPTRGIARWDGVQWHDVGGGVTGDVNDVVTLPDGGFIAGGTFSAAGGVPAAHIARWDGTHWWPLGSGLTPASASGVVSAVARLPSGDLMVAGNFSHAGGVAAAGIARWDGQAWHAMAAPDRFAVADLLVRADGTLLAAGTDTNPLALWEAQCVRRWTGSQWVPMGGPFSLGGLEWPTVWLLHETPAAELLAAGRFLFAGASQPESGMVQWNGSAWTSTGMGFYARVGAITHDDSDQLVISGYLTNSSGAATTAVQRNVQGAWQALPGWIGINGAGVLHRTQGGEIITGTTFYDGPGLGTSYFDRYTETNIPWIALHPTPFTTTPTLPVTLSATAATGYDNLTFQWQRETAPGSNQWTNLADGPGGASPNGGTVTGATGTVNGGQPALCTITNLAVSDAGNYRCIISNPCGQDESNPALVTITNPCPPDLTTTAIPGTPGYGTPNATLNNDDFFYYLQQYVAGNLAVADLTTTAIPGSPGYGIPNAQITHDDFFYYLILFSAGC